MRYSGVVVSILAAIGLANLGAQAEEMLNPPAALQKAPTPGRIIITPSLKSVSSPNSQFVPTLPADETAVLELLRSLNSSTVIDHPSTQERVVSQPPQLLSDTDIDPTIESAETRLGVHSVTIQSAATKQNDGEAIPRSGKIHTWMILPSLQEFKY